MTTPLLITHGENDTRVPIPQADEYYRLLKKLGKTGRVPALSRARATASPSRCIACIWTQEQEKWFAEYVLKKPVRPVSDN